MNEEWHQRSGLSLERLLSFRAVADAGAIAKAAPDQPARQSLMSRQIRELEEFFGTQLIRRAGRGLVLTEAGRELAALIRRQTADLGEFARRHAGRPQEVIIGAPQTVVENVVIPKLMAIASRRPYTCAVRHLPTHDIPTAVAEGRIDLGFVYDTPANPALAHRTVSSVTPRLVMSRVFILGTPHPFTVQSVLPSVPVVVAAGGRTREALMAYAEKHGIDLQIAITVDSHAAAEAAVRSRLGAAVLPSLVTERMPEADFHRLFLPQASFPERKLQLIWSERNVETRPSVRAAEAMF